MNLYRVVLGAQLTSACAVGFGAKEGGRYAQRGSSQDFLRSIDLNRDVNQRSCV